MPAHSSARNASDGFRELFRNLPEHLWERTRLHSPGRPGHRGKRVVYWTHHALRTDENPALDVALLLAKALQLPLIVYQGVSQTYRYASDRHHTFILEAASDLQHAYKKLGICYLLHVETPDSHKPVLANIARTSSVLVTEDFPIDPTAPWMEAMAARLPMPMLAVDTACVVPMQSVGKAYDRAFSYRDATTKLYAERISRDWPELPLSLPEECNSASSQIHEESGTLSPYPSLWIEDDADSPKSIANIISGCEIDHSIGPVGDTRGGMVEGYKRWNAFKQNGLKHYEKKRNQAEIDGVSRMSAYLHYGMVSPFRLAREAQALGADKFLDELLIWRELAYCFAYYRSSVDTLDALPAWARSTLAEHAADKRQHVYSWETTARARTHDLLWNAAQRSLLKHGELHNNIRMTWGKALLEWTANPSEALRRLIDLNHRYALDGRDPASYGGLLWCMGQFDRPFTPESPVIGTVRNRPTKEHLKRMDLSRYQQRVDRPITPHQPRIAIIGAGLGGLMCARTLFDHGLNIKVFDKSNRPSGRCSTRRLEDELQFDHGAQYFTCRDPRLAKYVYSWLEDGIVAPWNGRIVEIEKPGQFLDKTSAERMIGVPGMDAIGKHLANDLNIRFQTKVTKCIQGSQGYELQDEGGQSLGRFDMLLWNCPPVQIETQLATLGSLECSWKNVLSKVEMQPCWATLIAFEEPWSVPFDGAFVNSDSLSWIARNSSKLGRPRKLDCWVFHANSEWTKQHLNTSRDDIAEQMLANVSECVGIETPERIYIQSHRWLYAKAESALNDQCLWDGTNGLGACGDWCHGSRTEGALLSGMALAGRVLGHLHSKATKAITNHEQLSLF